MSTTPDPEDFLRFLREQQAAIDEEYRTPLWERVVLGVVLAVAALIVAAGVISAVVP